MKKLYDIRKAQRNDQILKAMETSSRSFDEIMAIRSQPEAGDEE